MNVYCNPIHISYNPHFTDTIHIYDISIYIVQFYVLYIFTIIMLYSTFMQCVAFVDLATSNLMLVKHAHLMNVTLVLRIIFIINVVYVVMFPVFFLD